MRTSSTRRLGAALSASTLALIFSLGSPAFGGEKGQGDAHRKDGAGKTATPYVSGSTDDDSVDDTSTEVAQPDGDNAHPSGKDRHEDNGTQGYSTSEPDDNDKGPERDYQGTDKPFETVDGTGGVDKEDQDGNNGCGNDDDFEDDNEGWCGQNPKKVTPPTEVDGTKTETETETCPAGTTMVEGGTAPKDCKTDEGKVVTEGSNQVLAVAVNQDSLAKGAVAADALQAAPAESAHVLGIQLERTAPAAVAAVAAESAAAPAGASVLGVSLARTGLSFTMLALAIAFGLLAIGFAMKRAGRTSEV